MSDGRTGRVPPLPVGHWEGIVQQLPDPPGSEAGLQQVPGHLLPLLLPSHRGVQGIQLHLVGGIGVIGGAGIEGLVIGLYVYLFGVVHLPKGTDMMLRNRKLHPSSTSGRERKFLERITRRSSPSPAWS